jgi:MYXO-CTERM domain-containing protein
VGHRIIAVAVVVASACTALHYSTTQQHSVVISNNPYTFNGAGSQVFVVSAAGSSDDDLLQSIYLMNCSSQWTLNTTIDPQQPVLGARVCSGLTMPSGSGSSLIVVDGDGDAVSCPKTYSFAVAFAGTQPGTSTCAVVVTSMQTFGSGTDGEVLVLTGVGSGSAGITVTPGRIDFQDVQILTTTTPTSVTVKNNGSASVTVDGTLTGSAFNVSPNPTTDFVVGPGSSAFFNVTCTPPVLGPHTGSLTFSAGSASASMGTTMLDCNGINSTVMISPTQVNFDNTLVGRPPANKTVMITGNASATIDSVILDSDAIAAGVTLVQSPQGQTVGTGKNIVLGYSAAAMHAGGPLGVLSVKVSSDASARSVGISGQALLGGLGTNPPSIKFGAVCAGDTGRRDIEVFASEAGDIILEQLTLPAAPFDAMVVDTLPKGLAGNHTGASATVRVTMTAATPGEFTDAIALTSNVPVMATTEVQLEGIALAGGIAATPNLVHFGTTAPDTTTSIKEVQLTNCGTTDLMFDRAQITGANATDFTLIGANPPRTLAPTESEVFMVVMQPETPGFKIAQLVLSHSEGTTVADLDGTAEGSPKDRETYYSCSTGHAAAIWPIGLALLALRRRRRRR